MSTFFNPMEVPMMQFDPNYTIAKTMMEDLGMREQNPMTVYQAQQANPQYDYYDDYYNEMQKKIDCDRARLFNERDAKADWRR